MHCTPQPSGSSSTCASAEACAEANTSGRTRCAYRPLSRAGVEYQHHPELAPTTELRHLQYVEDARVGVGKRSRVELAPEYRERYLQEILDRADLNELVAELPAGGAGALMCVERDPEACHRSLIAERLAAEHAVSIVHLRPDGVTPTR